MNYEDGLNVNDIKVPSIEDFYEVDPHVKYFEDDIKRR